MDGKSEVWTCSLTRFAWHSILFRSWIACIGLSLLLIVSFFEDCYKFIMVCSRANDCSGKVSREAENFTYWTISIMEMGKIGIRAREAS